MPCPLLVLGIAGAPSCPCQQAADQGFGKEVVTEQGHLRSASSVARMMHASDGTNAFLRFFAPPICCQGAKQMRFCFYQPVLCVQALPIASYVTLCNKLLFHK